MPVPLQVDQLAPKLDYLQRILDYAFGAQGDKCILDDHIGQSEVEKCNKEAEIIAHSVNSFEQLRPQIQSIR